MLRYSEELRFKERYYLEPYTLGWIFRKEGSDKVIKRDKHKQLLIVFARSYCSDRDVVIHVCDRNGVLEDIIEIKDEAKYKV